MWSRFGCMYSNCIHYVFITYCTCILVNTHNTYRIHVRYRIHKEYTKNTFGIRAEYTQKYVLIGICATFDRNRGPTPPLRRSVWREKKRALGARASAVASPRDRPSAMLSFAKISKELYEERQREQLEASRPPPKPPMPRAKSSTERSRDLEQAIKCARLGRAAIKCWGVGR